MHHLAVNANMHFMTSFHSVSFNGKDKVIKHAEPKNSRTSVE